MSAILNGMIFDGNFSFFILVTNLVMLYLAVKDK